MAYVPNQQSLTKHQVTGTTSQYREHIHVFYDILEKCLSNDVRRPQPFIQ